MSDIDKHIIIRFTDLEVTLIKTIGLFRYKANRDANRPLDKYQGKVGPEEADILGVHGDCQVAKFLNVEPNFDATLFNKASDGGIDLVYKTITIDVKATQCGTGRIIVPYAKLDRITADILILCYATMENLKKGLIVGWTTTEVFKNKGKKDKLRIDGPDEWILDNRYLIHPNKLLTL